jgi:hypothetical protein
MTAEIIDVRLAGNDGSCLVFVDFDGVEHTAHVLWNPGFCTLDVLEASSSQVETFVHSDSEVHDLVEARHSEFISSLCSVGLWFDGRC